MTIDPEPRCVDLLVVGGGINGVGIARDAAGRGLSVLLCEQDDLASGTSSRSGKLVHGGLRYLEYYDFRLVREALIETWYPEGSRGNWPEAAVARLVAEKYGRAAWNEQVRRAGRAGSNAGGATRPPAPRGGRGGGSPGERREAPGVTGPPANCSGAMYSGEPWQPRRSTVGLTSPTAS